MRFNLGSIAAIRRKFKDTFDRTDNGSVLGNASDGSIWTILRGTWGISTNKATSSTAASSYPIATITMPKQNVQIDLLDTSNGTGAALWVTDSGNWWGISVVQESVSTTNYCSAWNCDSYNSISAYNCNAWTFTCNSGYAAACNGGNLYYYTACTGNWNASTCSFWNVSNCKSWFSGSKNCATYNGSNCGAYNASTCNSYGSQAACYAGGVYYYCVGGNTSCSSGTQYFISGNCNPGSSYSYACGTTVTYPVYFRLYQSVANTVTQIAQQTLASLAQSMRITTSGSQITAKAYSDAAQVTQIGTDWVYTPTGASLTTSYGIVVTPTNYSQGSTIGDISIS